MLPLLLLLLLLFVLSSPPEEIDDVLLLTVNPMELGPDVESAGIGTEFLGLLTVPVFFNSFNSDSVNSCTSDPPCVLVMPFVRALLKLLLSFFMSSVGYFEGSKIDGDNTADFFNLAVMLSGYTVDLALFRNPFFIAGEGAVVGVAVGVDLMVLSVLVCIDDKWGEVCRMG